MLFHMDIEFCLAHVFLRLKEVHFRNLMYTFTLELHLVFDFEPFSILRAMNVILIT